MHFLQKLTLARPGASEYAFPMNNGRLDRALQIAIFAAIGGLYWQMFEMNNRLTTQIAEVESRLSAQIAEVDLRLSTQIAEVDSRLSAAIAELSERLGRVETHILYLAPISDDSQT